MTEREESNERERGIVITRSFWRHHGSILTALLMHDVFTHHSVGVSAPKVAEVLLSPWYIIVSPDMNSEHMQYLLEQRGNLPIVVIDEVPHVPFVRKEPHFEQMLADDLNKQIKEMIKASLYFFDDSEDNFRKEQQKLRTRHYKGKMNSPKK